MVGALKEFGYTEFETIYYKLCRHVIDLGGCFLKDLYIGKILEAIGRDPNDQMLPITFAVVKGENKDN